MKQKKSLELTSKISLEVLFSEDRTELNFRIGKKEYRISDDEIKELRDWLTNEVIGFDSISTTSNGPRAAGPLVVSPNQEIPAVELENRRAVVRATAPLVANGLRVENLSMDISKARDAFSREHINDGGPGNQ